MAGHGRHRIAVAVTGLRRAVAFLTPLGGAAAPDAVMVAWFPLTGALIGAGVGLVWLAASQVWSPFVAAALAVAADLALTGMLHFDGLVDSADGLLPHMQRERRLEVMREPTVGAYGVIVAPVAIVLRVAALATITPGVLLLAGLWTASRTVMALTIRVVPYARASSGGGLATAMSGGSAAPVAIFGLVLAVALVSYDYSGEAIGAVVVCAAAGGAVIALARRKLGGFTGDVLGAAGVVGETMALLVVAAR
jgi:adenosylcobinamide-GDP ribazoletransferase